MSTECKPSTIFAGSLLGGIGFGLALFSLIMLIILAILKVFQILTVSDLYLWIAVISSAFFAIIGVIGSTIRNACVEEESPQSRKGYRSNND